MAEPEDTQEHFSSAPNLSRKLSDTLAAFSPVLNNPRVEAAGNQVTDVPLRRNNHHRHT